MNPLRIVGCRLVQKTLKFAQHFLVFPFPELLNGQKGFDQVPTILKEKYLYHPLIMMGRHVSKSSYIQDFLSLLEKEGIAYSVYTDIHPDPQITEIDRAYLFYTENHCDCLFAIGGGSVLDATKALGIKIAYPKKSLKKFRGLLKVHRKIPFFLAAPTTAGTGSEATVASVVTDGKDKYAINDPHLIPKIALLEDKLLSTLPERTIALTGMDAFTHAIEAYIGKSNTKLTCQYALSAMSLISENLLAFYQDKNNASARNAMLLASYQAGVSFTRAYVGYVHALAHAIGGYYHVEHGYAIAILLPYVLKAYGSSIDSALSDVYDVLNLGNKAKKEEKRIQVIQWIEDMNRKLNIPSSFQGLIEEDKYDKLASHADKEANPIYPVPKELNKKELKEILVLANRKREGVL